MTNDGTKSYDHHRDGITQQSGGCLRDFRNKPFPIRIKLEYYKRTLTVYYHGGLNNDLSSFEICARVENIDLPKNGHFGISAETGGLADDHDTLSFVTHSLIDHAAPEINTPSTEEQKKYDKEYEEFLKQLEAEKEKYNKEHPEKQHEQEEKPYQDESEREFRMILDVQNSIHSSIRSLDGKIAEIVGRQERIVSLLTTNNFGQQQQQQQQVNGQQNQIAVDTFRRDEVIQVMNQQNELVRTLKDVYASISDVHRKTNYLHDSAKLQQNQQPVASQAQANQIDPQTVLVINENVRSIRAEIAGLAARVFLILAFIL
jgi:mannose-binding lectin 1